MTRISKALSRGSLLGMGVALLATATLTSTASAAVNTTRESQFCANLTTSTNKITSRLTDLRNKASAAADARDQQIASRQETWDQKIQAARAAADQKRTTNLEKLLAKAKGGNQLGAAQEYQRVVLEAVETRRTANDEARAAYREAVATVLASSRTNMATDADAYAQKVAEAKDAAAASCKATSADGPAIRKTMTASLKEARDTFKTDRQDRVSTGYAIKELAERRNQTIKANNETFKKTTEAARDKLRTALQNEEL